MKKALKEQLKSAMTPYHVKIHKDGTFSVCRSFFYRNAEIPAQMTRRIEEAQIPNFAIKILDSGTQFKPFQGGTTPYGPRDSFYWVKCQLLEKEQANAKEAA